MTNNDEVREALREGQPLFFADTDRDFRKAFTQRWYTSIKKQFKRRTRSQAGTYQGQDGTFVWSEEIR